ncbi:glycosyl hydrolase 115 family protein [Flaviramulus sp. BrNp1-15]|uniref:glycosyl hydrolase 115 family protein n=1 Tax=Flaviramulus sp. BrNp1-15 TaxID=2916754 RepID=UPI001EE81AF4|nr:glycosyl hydrolase 115 family protein [Flaviramulus sp. BrNp1-15]ULC60720.1 glycosyl hydrolase 115 family protein [Flaviramulus sp. BrNp1-15]
MKSTKKVFLLVFSLLLMVSCKSNSSTNTQDKKCYVQTNSGFAVVNNNISTSIYLSNNEYVGVKKIAQKFQEDIERITSIKPNIITGEIPSNGTAIIVGTIGNSDLIDKLIAENKLDVSSIQGKWETFLIQTIENPMDGVDEALVIVGSDKRGTIYGMFDMSYEMGVSPLYFWCDVPAKKKENVFIARGSHTKGTPKVKYRGIFINDEAPSLTNWVYPKFGGFNAKFYDHVFELILRMKGNYLWPAMWQPRAFYVDDPQNAVLADEYGIVMGTSHHEPLTRAHAEWRQFGEGEWNYNTNPENLKKFWTEAMERLGDKEALITIGMRGDGDEALSEETATEMLEKVVADQRKIIENVTGKPASETPQMWALYKEVMDYYDKGMRVPDDVTLLLCDDNWGNIRKLPALDSEPRSGGYGIYYHFDYVGGPRNYKWINTTQIERVWEQMHLAYQHNVKDIWIVNVGDIKPMEFPIEFFLDYAWNPDKWTADNLQDYYTEWSTKQFGSEYAEDIADLVKTYTKYNARRKHELLNIPKYSLTHYNEADNMLADFKALEEKALALKEKLPHEYLDAYFHLVEHPIVASANLNELYIAAFKNKMYAEQGNVIANDYAQKVKNLYLKDSLITKYYHEDLAGGKWDGIMSQMHIGYTSWQQSRFNNIPETVLVDENTEIKEVEDEETVSLKDYEVPSDAKGFIENNGYISIEAHNFSSKTEPEPFEWKIVENLGKTGSSVISLPIKKGRVELSKNSPKLSYNVHFQNTGKVKVHAYFSPTLNYSTREGMYYGLSFDDEKPLQVNYDSDSYIFNYNGKVPSNWHNNVADNIKIITTEFEINKAGNHILNYFRVDEGLVLQKIVIETTENGIPKSYLGPPQSKLVK